MDTSYAAREDIVVLSHHESGGPLGYLPVHAYLIKAREPILVETGLYTETAGFVEALRAQIDSAELRWILITHEDLDHAGNLEAMLAAAPKARLVLSFLAMLKIARPDLTTPERVRIATPGEPLLLGERRFACLRPPVFDSSATVAYFDETTRSLFSADCFGALVPEPTAVCDARDPAYQRGSSIFMSANSAWVHDVDPARFASAVASVRALAPELVLATHGEPVRGQIDVLCEHLAALPAEAPFEFPDDAGFRAMLEQLKEHGGLAA